MDLKIFTDNVEPKALDQIYTLVKQPAFADCKVRIMPDVHAGAGCVIGFTADLGDKVIPNIVGVDIGCGMFTCELGKIDIDFERLDALIRERVPSGQNANNRIVKECPELDSLVCLDALKDIQWIRQSMGTLGGGNHFIEVDADGEGNKYLVIHTGSRNLGKQVAENYQNVAIEKMLGKGKLNEATKALIAELKAQGKQAEIEESVKQLRKQFIPDEHIPKELCYLMGEDRENYLHDMRICQNFAHKNRLTIAQTICDGMGWKWSGFETIHNYIDHANNIVRKGAISAKNGERVLIPINMRDGCIIGIGKGNDDWNCSAPHGAGRIMSRAEAKKTVTLEEYEQSMQGIFTTSVNPSTIDESPMAYKTMDEILKFIEPTVKVERIIKPVYNFKASE